MRTVPLPPLSPLLSVSLSSRSVRWPFGSSLTLVCCSCLAQLMEDLEQLKVIEHGYKIKVIMVDHCAHGVDEPEDVPLIEAKIKELGLE